MKYTIRVLFGLFIASALVVGYAHTSLFKNFVKKKLVNLANEHTGLNLSVEDIQGKIFKSFSVMGVRSQLNDTTVIYLPEIKVDYDLRSLFDRRIKVDSLIIYQPEFFFRQSVDSTWNLGKIFRMKKKKKAKKEFRFSVEAGYLAIINGEGWIQALSDKMPDEITDLELVSAGSYREKILHVGVSGLSFTTDSPSVVARSVKAGIQMDPDALIIRDFLLESSHTRLRSNAYYDLSDSLYVSVEADSLGRDDVRSFLPDVHFLISPELSVYLHAGPRSTDLSVDIKDGEKGIMTRTHLPPFPVLIRSRQTAIPFTSTVSLQNMIPEQWIRLANTGIIANGSLTLEGESLFEPLAEILIKAEMPGMQYQGEVLDRFTLSGGLRNGKAKAEIELGSVHLDARIHGDLTGIYSEPEYSLHSEIYYFDPVMISTDMDGTNIRGEVKLKGQYNASTGMHAFGNILLGESSLNHIPLDSGRIYGDFKDGLLRMDSLYVWMEGGWVKGRGQYQSSSGEFLSELYTVWDSTASLPDSFHLPFDFSRLRAEGSVYGYPDEVNFVGVSILDNVLSPSLMIREVRNHFEGSYHRDTLSGEIFLQSYGMQISSIACDSLQVRGSLQGNRIEGDMFAWFNDSTTGYGKTGLYITDSVDIRLDSLRLTSLNSEYRLHSQSGHVVITNEFILIPEIHITDALNPGFGLRVRGMLTGKDDNDFTLQTENLDVRRLNRILPTGDSVRGLINTEINLKGRLENLTATGNVLYLDPGYGNFRFSELSGTLGIVDQQLEADLFLKDLGNGAHFHTRIPFILSRETEGISFKPSETFYGDIRFDSLSLDQVYGPLMQPGTEVNGFLDAGIRAEGSFKVPLFYGDLKLYDLFYQNHQQGILIDRINGRVNLSGNRIDIDTLSIQQEKGKMQLKGYLTFDTTLLSGSVSDASMEASANNFVLRTTSGIDLTMNMDAYLKSAGGKPEFGGELRIIQSNINLDEMARSRKPSEEEDLPLLVQAVYKDTSLLPGEEKDTLQPEELSRWEKQFLKDVNGRLKVVIPYNTWLRNENMSLELQGEVDLVLTEGYPEVFGEIDINRGFYILYGKKINIQEGKLSFQGGEKIDPILYLSGELTFRGQDGTAHSLGVVVSGNLLEPELEFALDDKSISETEAINILIFGKTTKELEVAGYGEMVSSFGAGQISQMITAQLNRTLGSSLNLDYIELTSSDNWQSASVVVGTYVTNDLFVTYQQGFGESEDEEITPREVSLEYRLNELLFVRMKSGTSKSSGLDVILKFEEKKKK